MGSGYDGTCFSGVDVCGIGMMDQGSKESRSLTFSQREGKAPLPEPLQTGELTAKFRNQVWRVCAKNVDSVIMLGLYGECFTQNGGYWKSCYESYVIDRFNTPHDEVTEGNPGTVKKWLKKLIIERESHETLTLLEYILRFPETPEGLANSIKDYFHIAPYFIDESDEPVCIVPTTSKEMKESVTQSLENINKSELTGSKSHLRNASSELADAHFAASIRESIHAVESAARRIDPKSSKNLNAALNSLEQNGLLKHPALKDGIKKLYGYTSDKEGIRHPLIDSKDADVGFDEAIFVYAACVSFVDYLVNKQRQLEKVIADNKPQESLPTRRRGRGPRMMSKRK